MFCNILQDLFDFCREYDILTKKLKTPQKTFHQTCFIGWGKQKISKLCIFKGDRLWTTKNC